MSEELKDKLGIKEDKPTDWFEIIYSKSNTEGNGVPWANMGPHPIFKRWITNNPVNGKGKTALVIGCGMGDDAIALEARGFTVTAFDVSSSAIGLCKRRFPTSSVTFVQADLLEELREWHQKFDFVLEIFTIQALPPKYECLLIQNISDFVSKKGTLAVITEVQQENRNYKNGPPWLLNSDYAKTFEACGLTQTFHSNTTETKRAEEIHLTIFKRNR